MVNTIWKENFLIMCSKLCLNARDSGHFAQLLLICRNYSLQTLCGAPHNVCNDNGIAENLPLNRILGNYDIIHKVNPDSQRIQQITAALKQLRQEERLCRKIAEQSLEVQQHLTEARRDRAEQQQREQEHERDRRPNIDLTL